MSSDNPISDKNPKIINQARRLLRRANFRLKANEYEAAMTIYEQTLEYFPDSIEILNNLGAINYQLGKFKQAVRYFRDSIVIEDLPETKSKLAMALLQTGKYEEVYAMYDAMDNPDLLGKAAYCIASLRLNLKYNEAKKQMQSVLPAMPFIDPHLGELYFQMGDYNSAVSRFRRKTDNWKYAFSLGLSYLGMRSFDLAKHNISRAIVMLGTSDEHADIQRQMHYALSLCSYDPKERYQNMQKYLENHEKTMEIHLNLIATAFEMGGFEEPFPTLVREALETMEVDRELFEEWMERAKEESS